jgi:hypothetical protein
VSAGSSPCVYRWSTTSRHAGRILPGGRQTTYVLSLSSMSKTPKVTNVPEPTICCSAHPSLLLGHECIRHMLARPNGSCSLTHSPGGLSLSRNPQQADLQWRYASFWSNFEKQTNSPVRRFIRIVHSTVCSTVLYLILEFLSGSHHSLTVFPRLPSTGFELA